MVDFGSLWRGAAGLALVALRSFLGTLLVFFAAGCCLAAASAYFLRGEPLYAAIAAAVAVAESLATGILLGVKRAIVLTLVHGLSSLQLGRATLHLVFERLLGIPAGGEFGNRGSALAVAAERLPLAQAESHLTATVNYFLALENRGGWLRRCAEARLLRTVQRYTLVRFRAEGARYGGVDLLKVRDELEATADNWLVRKLRGGLNLWTALAIFGLPAVVFAQTYLLIALLNMK